LDAAGVEGQFELAQLAGPFAEQQPVVADHRHPGGVVPAVLHVLQAGQNNLRRALATDVADDSTHEVTVPSRKWCAHQHWFRARCLLEYTVRHSDVEPEPHRAGPTRA